MEEHPFPDFSINDFGFMDSSNSRGSCPKCGKSRKYYCYTCYTPVNDVLGSKFPKVKLPIKIDIIKHPSECDGKSTSPHAAVLAAEHVTIYEYPCIPNYSADKTILVFPGPNSLDLQTLIKTNSLAAVTSTTTKPTNAVIDDADVDSPESSSKSDDNLLSPNTSACVTSKSSNKRDFDTAFEEKKKKTAEKPTLIEPWFDKVVFIDSTWNQAPTISSDERLKHIQRVELKLRKTKFWRNQDGNPDEYLSTIEAIYYFLCDFHHLCVSSSYKGEYDNLLFFFLFTYNKIRNASNGGDSLKAYSRRKKNQLRDKQSTGIK